MLSVPVRVSLNASGSPTTDAGLGRGLGEASDLARPNTPSSTASESRARRVRAAGLGLAETMARDLFIG